MEERGVGRERCIIPFVPVNSLGCHSSILQGAGVTEIFVSKLAFKMIKVRIERIVIGNLMFHKLRDAVADAVQAEIFGGDAMKTIGVFKTGKQRVSEGFLQTLLCPKRMEIARAVELANYRIRQGGVALTVNLAFNKMDIIFFVIVCVVFEPVRFRLHMLFPLTSAKQDERGEEKQP